jgi:hypothetical protein
MLDQFRITGKQEVSPEMPVSRIIDNLPMTAGKQVKLLKTRFQGCCLDIDEAIIALHIKLFEVSLHQDLR